MTKNFEKNTLLWHDYETFGTNPMLDGVAQFAAIRTDEDLNIIGKPINILCRPLMDRLPHPEACMITGISPLDNLEKGKNEASFFEEINKEIGKKGTCGVGYNNINFDDEVTRNGFYRNFIDPYRREWADGCSRWDLLNVLRMVDAVAPNTFVVPTDPETGNKIFKLDRLSPANNIEHENAHDALADVEATIKLAKIVKDKEPELFKQLYEQRKKANINDFVKEFSAYIIADSYFGAEQSFIEVIYPIYKNNNDVHCIKLTKNIEDILKYSPEELKEKLFKKKEDMLENEGRLPIHTFKINQCPVILQAKALNKETSQRLGISGEQLRNNIEFIKNNKNEFYQKIKGMFSLPNEYPEKDPDVDTQIYGGFFEKDDVNIRFKEIKSTPSAELLDYLRNGMKSKIFADKRTPEMLFRYVCRNFEDALDPKAYKKWNEHCLNRINEGKYSLTFEQYEKNIEELRIVYADNQEKIKILNDLIKFSNIVKEQITN